MPRHLRGSKTLLAHPRQPISHEQGQGDAQARPSTDAPARQSRSRADSPVNSIQNGESEPLLHPRTTPGHAGCVWGHLSASNLEQAPQLGGSNICGMPAHMPTWTEPTQQMAATAAAGQNSPEAGMLPVWQGPNKLLEGFLWLRTQQRGLELKATQVRLRALSCLYRAFFVQ
jgi:hypothetical protein